AARLDNVPRAERIAVREVGLHGQTVPVRESQLQVARIVVAIAIADGRGDRRRLAIGSEWAVDWIVRERSTSPAKREISGVGDASPCIEWVGYVHIARIVDDERGCAARGHGVTCIRIDYIAVGLNQRVLLQCSRSEYR